LSGNIFINAREGEGAYNTNSISIRNLTWSSIDRYFLNLSKKKCSRTY
jgi:hypothetical protein